MRHDYVNFGFDNADVVIAVGYELQEFDPVQINPTADKKIIHIHRFPPKWTCTTRLRSASSETSVRR
ncbi:acetolactate synthase domain protein [Mycobacterium xenopi 3993]|nr:acetolactate synthase domain protein [Mycobacterium xenopi 3993]